MAKPAKAPGPARFDRVLDFLLDRRHPFWRDERQGAIYNEASAAALQFQALLLLPVASGCLFIWGRPALWAVLAIVGFCSLSQYLVFGILRRENVELFPPDWRKQVSPSRRIIAPASVSMFFFACAWVQVDGQWFDNLGFRLAMVGVVVIESAALVFIARRLCRTSAVD